MHQFDLCVVLLFVEFCVDILFDLLSVINRCSHASYLSVGIQKPLIVLEGD